MPHNVPTTLNPMRRGLRCRAAPQNVARLCGPQSERLYGGLRSLAKIGFIMENGRTAEHWLIKATTVLQRVTGAQSRLCTSIRLNEIAMLAAADELEAATREATLWMVGNDCPDLELEGRVAVMLNTCTEVALTAQRAIVGPYADLDAARGRLGDLLAIIGFQLQTLDIC